MNPTIGLMVVAESQGNQTARSLLGELVAITNESGFTGGRSSIDVVVILWMDEIRSHHFETMRKY